MTRRKGPGYEVVPLAFTVNVNFTDETRVFSWFAGLGVSRKVGDAQSWEKAAGMRVTSREELLLVKEGLMSKQLFKHSIKQFSVCQSGYCSGRRY